MEKFVTWYCLLLKSHGKRPDTWLVLLGMICLTLLLFSVTLPDNSNTRVLVYCADGEFLSEVMDALAERESVFSFEEADSLEEARRQVISGQAECAFELRPDFRERLREMDVKGLVTYYAASFTTKGEVAKETLYAALLPMESEIFLELAAPVLYENADGELLSDLKERQQEYLEGTQIFTLEEIGFLEDGEYEKEPLLEAELKTQPVRGTLALFLFLFLFFSAGEIQSGEYSGFLLVLDRRKKLYFSLAYCLSAVTLPGIAAFFLLCSKSGAADIFPELVRFLFFIAYSVVWCIAVSSLLRTRERYLACAAALLLLNVLLCPVYMDASGYFPVIGYLRFFLPVGVYLM